MRFRPTLSLFVVLITLAASAYLGWSHSAMSIAHAQELPSDVSRVETSSIQDKFKLAQIRLAIRLQEVQVAIAERRLLGPGTEHAAERLASAERDLLKSAKELSQLRGRQEKAGVASEEIQAAEMTRQSMAAQVKAYKSASAAHADKIAVHDEKIKLLELRAELAKSRLDQLKRQLKE